MARLKILFVTVLISLAWSEGRALAEPPVRIMPLGDSITVGSQGGYRTRLFALLNTNGHSVDFVGSVPWFGNWPELPDADHEGHGGWRINNIKRNIVDWMTIHEPDVILLHIGTNDVSNNESSYSVSRQLWFLLDTIYRTDPEVTVYVASIILRVGNTEHVRVTEEYAANTPYIVDDWADRGFDCRFVNMHDALSPSDLEDDVHPNLTGYDKMAVVWASAIDLPLADMTVTISTPHPDQEATLTAVNAAPSTPIHFFATLSAFGSTAVDALGVTLDLHAPAYLGQTTPDDSGRAELTGTVDARWARKTVWIQAAQSGRTSQVLVTVIRRR